MPAIPTVTRYRFLIAFAFLIPALAALAILASTLLKGEKVRQLVINSLNERLLVPVEAGDISLTLLHSFPDVSVVLNDLKIKPKKGLSGDPGLLSARRISLRMGLFGFLTGNYTIKKLVVEEAVVKLWQGPENRVNYLIFKSSIKNSDSPVSFEIKSLSLVHCTIAWIDQNQHINLNFGLPRAEIRARSEGAKIHLRINLTTLPGPLHMGTADYSPAAGLDLISAITIDNTAKKCTLSETSFRFAGINGSIAGMIGFGRSAQDIALNFTVADAPVRQLLTALPAALFTRMKDYKLTGVLSANATLSGKWGKHVTPSFFGDFSLRDARLTDTPSGNALDAVNVSGKIELPFNGIPKIELTRFAAKSGQGRIAGSAGMIGFNNPVIHLKLSADIDLAGLGGFLPETINEATGRLAGEIEYKGDISGRNLAVTSSGSFILRDAAFTLAPGSGKISALNAQVSFDNGRVYIDKMKAQLGETDISINGYLVNLAAYLLNADQPLDGNLNISSANFRLEDALLLPANMSDTITQAGLFPKMVKFKADIGLKKFSFRKFTAENAQGNFTLTDNVMRTNNLKFDALGGSVEANGLINSRYNDHAALICNARLNNVDIRRLFYEFNDFGQSELQSRHISGRGDATVQLSATLGTDLVVDAASVKAVADVEIRNGELRNFEPLQELSRFLSEDQLMNLKFSTLRNRIEITDQTVIIPEMEVQTSALNLKGYGAHTFDNAIDYHFSVRTSELRKNRRRNPPPPTAIEDDGLGQTRLFLHMTGTVDNPEIAYDKKAVVNKIATDFQLQKLELRNAIRQEFSRNKPGPDPQKAKKQTQFQIEWDEDNK